MRNSTIQWLAALLAFCLLLGVAPAAAAPGIQDLIDAASPGDTIYIDSGTYNESVTVNKTVTLIGNDTIGGMPIVDAGGAGSVFSVTADDVVIESFEITGSGDDHRDLFINGSWGEEIPDAGVAILGADNVTIRGCRIADNGGFGMYIEESAGTVVEENFIAGNPGGGIWGFFIEACDIRDNRIDDTENAGILILGNTDILITGNRVRACLYGIGALGNDLVISGNEVSDCLYGIVAGDGENIRVADNTACNNGLGMYLASMYDSVISANNVSGNDDGMWIAFVENSQVADNTACNNGLGIFVASMYDSVISANNVSKNGLFGMEILAENIEITGNTARFNGRDGLYGYLIGSTIRDNVFTDNGYFGLNLGSYPDFIITAQESSPPGTFGGNTVTQNTASGAAGPVMIGSLSGGNTIYLNDFLATDFVPFPRVEPAEAPGEALARQLNDEADIFFTEKYPVAEFIPNRIPAGEPVVVEETLWNSPEEWHYKYNDQLFFNYTGNYWYCYNGTDANGDGIGDTPFNVTLERWQNLGVDSYPLMESYTHYPRWMLTPEGGGDTAEFDFVTDGTVLTSFEGKVYQTTTIASADGVAKLTLPRGTVAFDADGNPIREITIEAVDEVPAVPEGAVFTFAGYAYECTPAGATFDPAITLTFTLTAEEWEALEGDLTVRFYNAETGEWEDVPATYDPVTHTVTAEVSHFTVFALFAEGTAETAPAAETTTAEPTAAAEPAETTAEATAEATTAAPAEPTETPASPLVFAPVLALGGMLILLRRK